MITCPDGEGALALPSPRTGEPADAVADVPGADVPGADASADVVLAGGCEVPVDRALAAVHAVLARFTRCEVPRLHLGPVAVARLLDLPVDVPVDVLGPGRDGVPRTVVLAHEGSRPVAATAAALRVAAAGASRVAPGGGGGWAVGVALDGEPLGDLLGDVLSPPASDGDPRPDGDPARDGCGVALLVLLGEDRLRVRPLRGPGAARRFAAALAVLLPEAVAGPQREVDDLPLLDAAGEAAVLRLGRGPERAGPSAGRVHERVAGLAARDGDAVALVHGDRHLTYRELDRRAARLSRRLRGHGVVPGDVVALCAPPSPDLVVGMLAVLRAGAAYLPTDPGRPAEHLDVLLRDARPRVLLVDAGTADAVPDVPVPRLRLDADLDDGAPGDDVAQVGPDDVAQVILTSGTAGAPKGVLVPHRALENLVDWHVEAYGLTAADRCGSFAGPALAAFGRELWPALTAGAQVHLCRPAGASTPRGLMAGIVDRRLTVAVLPTALAEPLLAEPWPGGCTLRLLLTGGAALRRRPPEGLPFTLVDHYGPAECAGVATAGPVRPCSAAVAPSSGGPITGARVLVLDDRMRPVPVGVPGHLHLGGDVLAAGYLHRPELTAERFVPDPFAAASGPDAAGGPAPRLHRTGDLAAWRPDGTLHVLGRLDAEVVVRGRRVEPGEIEEALRAHPQVADAAVALHPGARGEGGAGARLVAYVVATARAAAGEPTAARLRGALARRLPGHLVPTVYVRLAALPLTGTGRVDRRALPPPVPGRDDELAAFVAPHPGTEAELARLWAQVLDVEAVGADDDFFATGGTSPAAARLAVLVRERWDVDLPPSAVFAEPTLRTLARHVDGWRGDRSRGDRPPLPAVRPVPGPRTADRPLTRAQEQLWPPDGPSQTPVTVELTGPLDPGALAGALRALTDRHEALRTTVAVVDGEARQRVADAAPTVLERVDAADVPDVDAWVRERSRRPLDPATGPMVRWHLLHRGPLDHLLLAVVHQLVFDGHSLGVLCGDLAELYRAGVESREPELPVPVVQPGDVAVWEREHLTDEALAAGLDHWRAALADLPPPARWPADLPGADGHADVGASAGVGTGVDAGTGAGSTRGFAPGACAVARLDPDLTRRVEALARRAGTTAAVALLAAFQVLLGRAAGTADVVVGGPAGARLRPELEPLVGCFLNTLPLRADLSGDPTFRQVLERVRAATTAAHQHQAVPLQRIRSALARQAPLFSTVLAFEDAHDPDLALAPGLQARVTWGDAGRARWDLALSLAPADGGLRVRADYRTDVYLPGTVEDLLEHYATLLAAAVADPDARIAGLPVLSPAQRRRLLVDRNATAAPYPDRSALHHLVEQQVDRTPGAVALAFEHERRMTYAQLDAAANRLAYRLLALGVRGGDRVGVCLHRSAAAVVAVLGVLKAGAAYVPLDPPGRAAGDPGPPARLVRPFADAGVAAVLTTPDVLALLPPLAVPVLDPTCPGPHEDDVAESRPELPVRPDDPACVLYPEPDPEAAGVMITHRAVCNLVAAVQPLFGTGPRDRVLQSAPAADAAWLLETFGALARGAWLHLARESTLTSTPRLAAFLRLHAVSVVALPPDVLRRLPADAFPDLRLAVVRTGPAEDPAGGRDAGPGEGFDGAEARRWAAPGRRLVAVHGPPEGVGAVLAGECDPGAPGGAPTGRPLANLTAFVLDRSGRPVPVGVPGELCIGGVGLARGYLGRPDLTRERFVQNPMPDAPSPWLFRTGERARLRPDGRVEVLGRVRGA